MVESVTERILARMRSMRNLLTLLVCGCALLTGCSMRMFFRVDSVAVDSQLRLLLGGGGNSFVFLHRGGAFISDPKFAMHAKNMRAALRDTQHVDIERMLLTHSHADHVGGLPLYQDLGAVIVHPNTRKRLEAEGLKAPWVNVEQTIQLTLGGETIRILYAGRGHTDGDLVALFEKRKLLVAGDLISENFEPEAVLNVGGSLLDLRTTLQSLLSLDFDTVLPGHGNPFPRQHVEEVIAYLAAMESEVRRLKAAGVQVHEMAAQVNLESFPKWDPIPAIASRERNIEQLAVEIDALEKVTPR